MAKHGIVIIADYSQDVRLSLEELIEAFHLDADFILHLIEYQVIHPVGGTPDEWQFGSEDIKRILQARRLQRDLEINVAGLALVLDLLDELEDLRSHADFIERHLLK